MKFSYLIYGLIVFVSFSAFGRASVSPCPGGYGECQLNLFINTNQPERVAEYLEASWAKKVAKNSELATCLYKPPAVKLVVQGSPQEFIIFYQFAASLHRPS